MDTKLVLYLLGGLIALPLIIWAVKDFRKFEEKQQRVFTSGLRGEGTIVSVADGSKRKGPEREVVITLDVVVSGRSPFRAEASVFAGPVKTRELVAGARLPVLVDPVDASRVVVDQAATGMEPSR